MVAAGAEHTAAVTEDGDLYGWGWGRYGNLGLGDRNDRLIPERVSADDVCLLLFNLQRFPFTFVSDYHFIYIFTSEYLIVCHMLKLDM